MCLVQARYLCAIICLYMRRIGDIDILEDEILQGEIWVASMIVLLAGVLVGLIFAFCGAHEPVSLRWFLALAVLSLVSQPVHELVHAAGFMVASGFRAHIRFGFTTGMLYTSAEGTMLRKGAFLVVLLAPAVVVSGALAIGCCLTGHPLLAYFSCVLHLAGCTGDFSYCYLIAREPNVAYVEDTARGVSLMSE